MIAIRTQEEIEKLRASNELVAKTLGELAKYIKAGVSTNYLDKIAEEYIRDHGGIPAFLGYGGFPKTLCTSLNSAVVHGIPDDKTILNEGDIISVDCGVVLNEYYGDSAYTFAVGEITERVKHLLKVTKNSLFEGISEAREGKRIGDIGFKVQTYCENAGFSVVREMVGHGIGRKLHEAPEVPNYGKKGTGPMMKTGMVICIEPMINMGTRKIHQERDGWTIRTWDNLPSAHFELAVAIEKEKGDILGTFKYIEEVLGDKEF
ncbi:MAG TPA: type I methionyl aminopeptidase [Bacteroidales bacterium]|nr:type I methionyl aminopeptidase [Bacteroidales bacterium]